MRPDWGDTERFGVASLRIEPTRFGCCDKQDEELKIMKCMATLPAGCVLVWYCYQGQVALTLKPDLLLAGIGVALYSFFGEGTYATPISLSWNLRPPV